MKPTIYATHRYSVQNGRGDAVAHIEVDERGGSYWVTNLWVDPDHRRTGVATALMQRCITAWAHVDLYLAVQPYTDAPQSAEALARWYARFGFAPTDVPGVMHRPAHAPYIPPDPVPPSLGAIVIDPPPQFTLGDLITALEAMPPGATVTNLYNPHCYRGDYEALAFQAKLDAQRSAIDLLEHCHMIARGERMFTGYKGGQYRMTHDTPVWIAEPGALGDMLVGMHNGAIVIQPDTD